MLGHDYWTTPHDYSIDLEMLSFPDAGAGGTTRDDLFMSLSASASGDAQAISTSYNSRTPFMSGNVGTGSVTYTLAMGAQVEFVEFDIYLDIDGDGIKERGPGSVPIYAAIGSDERQVSRSNNMFRIKAVNPDLLSFSWSNMRHCDGSGNGCTSFTASAASSAGLDNPIRRQANNSVRSAQGERIILDPDILDYWSTPLVVPQDFNLTGDAINDVPRDNFYNNYTTVRVAVLDIGAFARWGYDFDAAFDFCPYAYYDELMPFKRVLCAGYWPIWYQKQWEKEKTVTQHALNVHNAYIDAGIYDYLNKIDSHSDSEFLVAGLDQEVDWELYSSLMSDLELMKSEVESQSASRFKPIVSALGSHGTNDKSYLEAFFAISDAIDRNRNDDQDIPGLSGFLEELITNYDPTDISLNNFYMIRLSYVEHPVFTSLHQILIDCLVQIPGFELSQANPDHVLNSLASFILAKVAQAATGTDLPADSDAAIQSGFDALNELHEAIKEFTYTYQVSIQIASLVADGIDILTGLVDVGLEIEAAGGVLGMSSIVDKPWVIAEDLHGLSKQVLEQIYTNKIQLGASDSEIISFALTLKSAIEKLMSNVEAMMLSNTDYHPDCFDPLTEGELPGAQEAGDYMCGVAELKHTMVQIVDYLKWISLEDSSDGLPELNRQEQALGTIAILANGLEQNWDLWEFRNNSEFQSSGAQLGEQTE